ncbi:hypothetical protein D3C72_2276060 [compost metagenome]
MQPDAVDTNRAADAVPVADVGLRHLQSALKMPGVTAQIDRYAIQYKLRAFAPEFAEAEIYSMPVDNLTVFEQL